MLLSLLDGHFIPPTFDPWSVESSKMAKGAVRYITPCGNACWQTDQSNVVEQSTLGTRDVFKISRSWRASPLSITCQTRHLSFLICTTYAFGWVKYPNSPFCSFLNHLNKSTFVFGYTFFAIHHCLLLKAVGSYMFTGWYSDPPFFTKVKYVEQQYAHVTHVVQFMHCLYWSTEYLNLYMPPLSRNYHYWQTFSWMFSIILDFPFPDKELVYRLIKCTIKCREDRGDVTETTSRLWHLYLE